MVRPNLWASRIPMRNRSSAGEVRQLPDLIQDLAAAARQRVPMIQKQAPIGTAVAGYPRAAWAKVATGQGQVFVQVHPLVPGAGVAGRCT
ncbi:hypothetical protein ACQEVF_40350 [Nonomuraea polychroma]|uniref:hypothetical protein n=1 Tax=Nonomuraea polychroma TaxID=46176 RepID=UPI003D8AB334